MIILLGARCSNTVKIDMLDGDGGVLWTCVKSLLQLQANLAILSQITDSSRVEARIFPEPIVVKGGPIFPATMVVHGGPRRSKGGQLPTPPSLRS